MRNRFRWRILYHCSIWFIHQQGVICKTNEEVWRIMLEWSSQCTLWHDHREVDGLNGIIDFSVQMFQKSDECLLALSCIDLTEYLIGVEFKYLNRADVLARDLLSEGITTMKIWPFDTYAPKSNGPYIRFVDLDNSTLPGFGLSGHSLPCLDSRKYHSRYCGFDLYLATDRPLMENG